MQQQRVYGPKAEVASFYVEASALAEPHLHRDAHMVTRASWRLLPRGQKAASIWLDGNGTKLACSHPVWSHLTLLV